MRRLTGTGKPKALQGEGGLAAVAQPLLARLWTAGHRLWVVITVARNWFCPARPGDRGDRLTN
jgi:hypothetical protein